MSPADIRMTGQAVNDHDRIQPASEFRRIVGNWHDQVLSASAPLCQHDELAQGAGLSRSPNGGVNLWSDDTYTQTRPLSLRLANVGVRRSRHSSLLESPARAGHSSQMRRMFEKANLGNTLPSNNGVVLYPQLPNISRECSPVARFEAHRKSRGPLLPRSGPNSGAETPEQLHSPAVSEHSSESWSGDSDYLVTEHHVSHASPDSASHPFIDDWLSTLSDGDRSSQGSAFRLPFGIASPVDENNTEDVSCHSHVHSTPSSVAMSQLSISGPSSRESRRRVSDRCLTSSEFRRRQCADMAALQDRSKRLCPQTPPSGRATQSKPREVCTPRQSADLDDGSVELSTLSANVCVERGPTRRHSVRREWQNPNLPETPTKRVGFRTGRLRAKTPQEVLSFQNMPPRENRSSVIPRSIFRRTTHYIERSDTSDGAKSSGGIVLGGL
ncbi:hypothetical protein BCR34DRAFT_389907 [Clohesyomyces aquaticus]|uniref:Uncharacterized protein n=1 Tax=Clohesyomyces aquaticus TaxID=1231657 RepID=A0A1Y1ZEP2_9PLEO|nr:hypothetical protein BCR34DRAFT_389907 [Clohesyomyces aquaticus]